MLTRNTPAINVSPQLLKSGDVDYLIYDYLAEITMSILVAMQAKNPESGYATDFVTETLKPNLKDIAAKNVKIVANAGGVNLEACATAARALVREAGLDLKVAIVSGDNITDNAAQIAASAPQEMYSQEQFPNPDKVASINTYLGAFPIAAALEKGADIVITGRVVDSALTLGICIHEFGWKTDQYNLLASGSLTGHLLECGPQVCGGNFTDWETIEDFSEIGYPVAEVSADGSFLLSKAKNTSGVVNVGTVSEQMLYETGDPQAYMLPDVVCDFSAVTINQHSNDVVHVSAAQGVAPTSTYKTCATYYDGFRSFLAATINGNQAAKRGQVFADAVIKRTNKTLTAMGEPELTATDVELLGSDSQFGKFADPSVTREVVVKIAAKYNHAAHGNVLYKQMFGLILSAPPGLAVLQGLKKNPTPIIRLFSYLTPKDQISITVDVDGTQFPFETSTGTSFSVDNIARPAPPETPEKSANMVAVPLDKLAWGRAGDKGDKTNVGIIARQAEYLPYIWNQLTEAVVAERFSHFIAGGNLPERVERFHLPGANAINFLIDQALGGGGAASLRIDVLAKGHAQLLLAVPIEIPSTLADAL